MEPIFLFRIEPSHIRCSSSFLWADKRIFLLLGIVGCIFRLLLKPLWLWNQSLAFIIFFCLFSLL